MIYLFIVFLIIIGIIRFDFGKSNISGNFLYNIVLILLIGIATFRRDLGGDTWGYMDYFELCPTLYDGMDYLSFFVSISLFDGYMPLWTLLNVLAKTVSSEFYILQFFQASIVNTLFFILFKKYTDSHKFLCILIYFVYSYWYLNAEIMREAISVAIGSFAVINCYRKKYKIFFIQLFLSFLFHPSALFLLVLLFLKPRQFDNISFFKYSIIATVLFVLSNIILLKIITILGSAIPLFDRISVYLNRGASIFGFIYLYLYYFFIPGIAALIISKQKLLDTQPPLYFILNVYFIVAAFVIPMIGLNRLFNYFTPFSIILFATLLVKSKTFKFTSLSKIVVAIVAVLVCYNCYSSYTMEYKKSGGYRYDLYFPYTYKWDDNKDVSYRRDIWVGALQDIDALDRSAN